MLKKMTTLGGALAGTRKAMAPAGGPKLGDTVGGMFQHILAGMHDMENIQFTSGGPDIGGM